MTAKAPATWVAIEKLIPWAANPREGFDFVGVDLEAPNE